MNGISGVAATDLSDNGRQKWGITGNYCCYRTFKCELVHDKLPAAAAKTVCRTCGVVPFFVLRSIHTKLADGE
jgi:hypothetical protein